jgi:hypothetical protein
MPSSSDKKNFNRKKDRLSNDDNDLITASIRAYLEEYKERKKLNQDNVEIITAVLEEYLDTFMIIGYNYDGEMISYSHAKTQVQIDALNTGIIRFINQHAVKPPQLPGYGPTEV